MAGALGVAVTSIDAEHPIGRYALRELTPLWTGPVGELDGAPVMGLHALLGALERMASQRVAGDVPRVRFPASEAERREHDNLLHVVFGALGAMRGAHALWSEGARDLPYLEDAEDRTRRALEWLEARLVPRRKPRAFHVSGAPGLPEIALFCALDWMREAEAYPVHIHAGLQHFLEAWEHDPLFDGARHPPPEDDAS